MNPLKKHEWYSGTKNLKITTPKGREEQLHFVCIALLRPKRVLPGMNEIPLLEKGAWGRDQLPQFLHRPTGWNVQEGKDQGKRTQAVGFNYTAEANMFRTQGDFATEETNGQHSCHGPSADVTGLWPTGFMFTEVSHPVPPCSIPTLVCQSWGSTLANNQDSLTPMAYLHPLQPDSCQWTPLLWMPHGKSLQPGALCCQCTYGWQWPLLALAPNTLHMCAPSTCQHFPDKCSWSPHLSTCTLQFWLPPLPALVRSHWTWRHCWGLKHPLWPCQTSHRLTKKTTQFLTLWTLVAWPNNTGCLPRPGDPTHHVTWCTMALDPRSLGASGFPTCTRRYFPSQVSTESLEEMSASSEAQTPRQGYRDHKESAKHDTPKGTQSTFSDWPRRNANLWITP